jgi:hypothetical protein
MRRLLASLVAAALLATVATTAAFASNGAGPPGGMIWAGNQLYRTVVTPTDFTGTGAPDSSYEPIYKIDTQDANVALAAPGEAGFRGGRWQVFQVTWNVAPYELTNGQAVLDAAEAGDLSIGSTPLKQFECPLIPFSQNG